jgi:hypothetical protein
MEEFQMPKEVSEREYLNAFFSYNETIDIYHAILLLENAYGNEATKFIDVEIDKITLKFGDKMDKTIEKAQEGLEILGTAQKQSMYFLFLLQMGLYEADGLNMDRKEKAKLASNMLWKRSDGTKDVS